VRVRVRERIEPDGVVGGREWATSRD
jgi:hypothetical protein